MIRINDKFSIGGGKIPFIAEIGLCHNGSVDVAKALVDLAVKSGADMVKFQKRDVPNLAIGSVLDAEDKRFPSFGSTYRAVREFIEFGREEFDEVFAYCAKRGILATCTPFDIPSLQFLKKYDLPLLKIASHSVTNLPLLEEAAKCGVPVLMSTGMCSLEEIDEAVAIFKRQNCPVALMHCVSSYPTNAEEANLRMIPFLKTRYECPVGLSTHEEGILATLCGAAIGADVIERHITLDHRMEGFDHRIAVDPNEMVELVKSLGQIEKLLAFKEKHISVAEQVTRDKYRVSAVSKTALKAGETLKSSDIAYKNPGTGISPKSVAGFIGKRIRQNVEADVLLQEAMFE